jgi:fatty acid-binding protein DegV
LAKTRTTSKAQDYILELMKERVKASTPIHAAVVHTHTIELALALKKAVEYNFNCAEIEILELGPVLGTHIGPGFFGLGFYSEQDWQPD